MAKQRCHGESRADYAPGVELAMRLSDDEFSQLSSLNSFTDYYETLTAAEMMAELDRIYTEGQIIMIMHQHLALHRRFVDYATDDQELTDLNRSIIISVAIDLRETIDGIIIPLLDPETAKRVHAALAGLDDYISRLAFYPTAAEAILSRTRNPPGPFVMGAIGQILVTDAKSES